MKISIKKFIAVLCCALLIGAAMVPSVFALDFFNNLGDILGDDFNGILDGLFGGNGGGDTEQNPAFNLSDLLSNPGGILDSFRESLANVNINVSNSAIANALVSLLSTEGLFDINSLLDSNDILSSLIAYFSGGQDETPSEKDTTEDENSTEESTTEEPTSYVPPTTLPPANNYNPGSQVFPESTPDESSSEPEYSYVEPSVEYTDALTTVPFSPVYDEDYSDPEKGISGKMIAGIAILVLAGAAVVVVAVFLKKTKV